MHSTRSPSCDASLLLSGCGSGAALCVVVQPWLFLRPSCFVRACRVVAPLDLQGSSLFACSSGWRVPCSLGLVCAPRLHELLVLCCVPSATHRPVTIRVATKNGWRSKPRVSGRSREGSASPFLLPTPQTHQEVFFTCRLTRSLNKAHDWDGARAWNHPSRPGRPHPSLQPPRGCCLGDAHRGLGALLPAPHTSPCRSSGPQTTPRPQAAVVGAVRSGPQAILCPS